MSSAASTFATVIFAETANFSLSNSSIADCTFVAAIFPVGINVVPPAVCKLAPTDCKERVCLAIVTETITPVSLIIQNPN